MSFDFDKSGILALQYHVYQWNVLGSTCCHNCRVDWLMGACGGIVGAYKRQKASLLGILLIALHFLTCCRHAKTSDCVWIAVIVTAN